MRLRIELDISGFAIPLNYNHGIQAAIYNHLSDEFRSFLHNCGFRLGKRSFKLFTFSRLLSPKRKIIGNYIVFRAPAQLYVSSPIERFVREFATSLAKTGKINIFGLEIPVKSISVLENPEFQGRHVLKTLSPITVYSTFKTPNGKKFTHYYSPEDPEFNELILNNLLKKAKILSMRVRRNLRISPVNSCRSTVVLFKDTPVKAWEGYFLVEGDPKLIELAYEVGLGSKNSAGFGMVEVVEDVGIDTEARRTCGGLNSYC